MSPLLVLLLLPLGCKKEDEYEAPTIAQDVSMAVGADVVSAIGPDGGALVRAVNEWGMSVPSTPVTLTVGGTSELVSFDGNGYARLSIETPGSFPVTGGLEDAAVHVVDNDWSGFPLAPAAAPLGEASAAEGVTGGVVIAGPMDVWWVGPGMPAHRVLTMPPGTLIDGMQSGHLDADGVLDLIVWGGEWVFLLKGRKDGGFAAGAAWQGEGYAAAGADIGDLDGDSQTDFAVAWADDAGNDIIEYFEGQGTWSYESVFSQSLPDVPSGLGIGDNMSAGFDQVTVMLQGGDWARYQHGDGYSQVGPDLDLDYSAGTTVLSGSDANGDGGDEIWLIGPRKPEQVRDVIIWDLVEEVPLYNTLEPLDAFVTTADVNGDGLTDTLLHRSDLVTDILTWDGTGYLIDDVARLPQHGPIAVSDFDGDHTMDLTCGAGLWATWSGFVAGDEVKSWVALRPDWTSLDLDPTGPMVPVELDGNPATSEIVTFVEGGGSTRLEAYRISGATVSLLGGRALSGGMDAPRDLAVCSGNAYALTAGGLYSVKLSDFSLAGQMATTSATRVDCGVGPSGAAVVLLDGSTELLMTSTLTAVNSLTDAGAQDVAFVDLGAGPAVASCIDVGCRVTRWAWGDAGEQGLASSTAATLSLESASGTVELTGGGELSTADVDGDGHLDLIASWGGGYVGVWRSTGTGIGPGEYANAGEPLTGPLVVVDPLGDGQSTLLGIAEDGSASLAGLF